MSKISPYQAEKLYEEHRNKSFFPEIVSMMTDKPVLLICLEGRNAVNLARKIIGATDPKEAENGTIRRMFGLNKGSNAIHGSDNVNAAQKEIEIFFANNEIFSLS
jgi:nucleoside-diphosphate kinase